jgi:hypothetical protein
MMASKKAEALFKVTASQTPWDRTNDAAREIISGETDQRAVNMKRLQALRLARDAEVAAAPPEQPATKRPRRKKA